MTFALFYDTETSGIPLFKEPSEHPNQPHIVQLAAALVDLDTRETVASMDVIVRPDNWVIPDDVAAIHGITTERAMDLGIPEIKAVDTFLSLWRSRTRIAHNESFDARIFRIALKRYTTLGVSTDEWRAGPAECTMRLATPIVKLPPTERMRAVGRNHFKNANLSEAYLHFTGKKLENAHSAMADVRGCIDVYFALRDAQQATN